MGSLEVYESDNSYKLEIVEPVKKVLTDLESADSYILQIVEPATKSLEIETGTYATFPEIHVEITNNSATLVSLGEIYPEDIVGLNSYLDDWLDDAEIDCGSP